MKWIKKSKQEYTITAENIWGYISTHPKLTWKLCIRNPPGIVCIYGNGKSLTKIKKQLIRKINYIISCNYSLSDFWSMSSNKNDNQDKSK